MNYFFPKIMRLLPLLLILIPCFMNITQAEVFKCKTESGKMTFSDKPCPSSQTQEIVKLSGDSNSQLSSCGKDFECFVENSKSCKPSKVRKTDTIEFGGMRNTITMEYRLHGDKDDKCQFQQDLVDIKIKYLDQTREKFKKSGKSESEINDEEKNMARNMMSGHQKLTCNYPQDILQETLARIRDGGGSTNPEYCFQGDATAACTKPPLASGCSLGQCTNGWQSYSCKDKQGNMHKCKIYPNTEFNKSVVLGCKDGKQSMSLGKRE